MSTSTPLLGSDNPKPKKNMTELGHNKNVANFNGLYQILEEVGKNYNPSNENLNLNYLLSKKEALEKTFEMLNEKKTVYTNRIAEKEVSIAPLGKILTKVLNYSKSINISSKDKENIASQVKKIRGDKKNSKLNPETIEVEKISSSQMSYDSRLANLKTLISQLSSHKEYTPNEIEIQIESLTKYHQTLSTLSHVINESSNDLITARKNRNQLLYFDETNIVQLTKDIKNYLKSLGDGAKPYYKAVVKLKFFELKK